MKRLAAISGSERPQASRKATCRDGFYTVDWISRTRLLSWAASGYALYDLSRPGRQTVLAADAVGLGAPREYDGTLYLGYDPYEFTTVRGTNPRLIV